MWLIFPLLKKSQAGFIAHFMYCTRAERGEINALEMEELELQTFRLVEIRFSYDMMKNYLIDHY